MKYYISLFILLNCTLGFGQELLINSTVCHSKLIRGNEETKLFFRDGSAFRLSLEFIHKKRKSENSRIYGIEWKTYKHQFDTGEKKSRIEGQYKAQSIGVLLGNRYKLGEIKNIDFYSDLMIYLDHVYSARLTGVKTEIDASYINGVYTINETEITSYKDVSVNGYRKINTGLYFRLGANLNLSTQMQLNFLGFVSTTLGKSAFELEGGGGAAILDFGGRLGLSYTL